MDIELNIVGGATWILNIDNKFKIGCDPVLAPAGTEYNFRFFKSQRMKEPVYDDSTFENIEIWLITHEHADHIDEDGIKRISKESKVVSNKNSLKLLNQIKDVSILNWNDKKHFKVQDYQINIEAVPAYHGSNFVSQMLAGKVNGYMVKIKNGMTERTIYITSDTVFHEKILKTLKMYNVDILIANMGEVRSSGWGGPLTMNLSMLEKFKKQTRPKHIIPVHIDDFSHYETSVETLEKNKIEVFDNGSMLKLN